MTPGGDSRPVRSAQAAPHPRLDEVVRRHLATPWRQPLHPPSIEAFGALESLLDGDERNRLVLDSGCGTGASTRFLADRHPGDVVIGVDQSAARLASSGAANGPVRVGNRVLVRAELATFWRLALDAGWPLRRHYLLYPNPWPKAAHLRRRWHGHPVFPAMLALGGRLVLRTNWKVYVDEFAQAVGLVRGKSVTVTRVDRPEGVSPFELKYAQSGHPLFEVIAG